MIEPLALLALEVLLVFLLGRAILRCLEAPAHPCGGCGDMTPNTDLCTRCATGGLL